LLQEKVTTNGATETHNFFYDNTGKPYAMQINGTTYYYVTNLQGDVMGMVDSAGNTVASYTYDPYGKLLTATGELADKNPLRYRGYYYDSESGLYYLQSRYYDPAVRRFINADSQIGIGNIGGYNLFSYCENDPVFRIDHSGEDGKTIELGHGWYCRIDGEDTNSSTQRHIHIWNEHDGTSYAQNDDGGPHDKGHNEKGKLPKWLQKQIESKTGWDYNGKRKSFFEQTSFECWAEGVQYLFADGTTTFEPTNQWAVIRDSVDSYEALYFRGNKFENSDSRTYGNKMLYWPIWGLGGIYLPELGLGGAFVPVLFGG